MIIYCVQIRISDIRLKKKAKLVERNIEARSLSHFCRGKAMSIIYYEFVCSLNYSACKRMRLIILSSKARPALPCFFTLSYK